MRVPSDEPVPSGERVPSGEHVPSGDAVPSGDTVSSTRPSGELTMLLMTKPSPILTDPAAEYVPELVGPDATGVDLACAGFADGGHGPSSRRVAVEVAVEVARRRRAPRARPRR
ncbi:hypothetical protein [Frigoribacterium sp. NPDC087798]|uniref:hypothetical protein n=1 Tax=Frigoribacterium sp. NPDC087798 TaxID=3363993 RepID=UPI0038224FF2